MVEKSWWLRIHEKAIRHPNSNQNSSRQQFICLHIYLFPTLPANGSGGQLCKPYHYRKASLKGVVKFKSEFSQDTVFNFIRKYLFLNFDHENENYRPIELPSIERDVFVFRYEKNVMLQEVVYNYENVGHTINISFLLGLF